jgi:hypothetical protein
LRKVELVAAEEGSIMEMVDKADVVSEGLAQSEAGKLVYYGSTSLLLPAQSRGGMLPDPEIETMAAVLAHDPHLRLRALRIAQREALSRASGELGPMRAEIQVSASEKGVVVTVDVVAVVDVGAAGGASR